MAIQQMPWQISEEDITALVSMPPISQSFIDQVIDAERRYLDEGIKRALSLWVSEMEPEIMFRYGNSKPFGITAKGHGVPYIDIEWDENFYLTGEPIRYPVKRRQEQWR